VDELLSTNEKIIHKTSKLPQQRLTA